MTASFDKIKDYNYCYNYNVKRRDLVTFKLGVQINCSRKKLWGLLISPGHLILTHPYCKEHIAEKWGVLGATDLLVFNNEKQKEREVIYMDKHFFILQLTQGDTGNDIKVKFETHELANEKCELFMTVSLDSFKNIPRPIWWLYAKLKLLPSYELYISSVIKGYKYYLEKNEEVTEDQFGYHPYYSKKK